MDTEKKQKNSGRISSKELAIFCHQLSVILSSDITILEGIKILYEQSEDRIVKRTLRDVYANMQNGAMAFSAAVALEHKAFPEYFVNLVSIGEESGALEETLLRLAEYYEKESKIKRKIRTAVTYPVVLSVLMIGVIVLLLVEVLPLFSDILTSVGGGALPAFTRGVMDIGDFFAASGALVLLIAAVVIIVLVMFFRHSKGGRYAWDGFAAWFPLSRRILTRLITSRFARGMSIQLSAGISISVAMEHIRSLVSNTYVAKKLEACYKKVQAGDDFYDSLDGLGLFTPLFMRMVMIGQKTGNLDVMLAKAAGLFEEEVDSSLDKLVTSVEPVLIMILSVVVGLILFSVMLPMIDIISSIG